jgi:starch phosphorylase
LEYQNEIESKSMYEMLEKEIVPLFYNRGQDDVPREWIKKMKTCMKTIGPSFNTNRMIEDYTEKFYISSIEATEQMKENNYEIAKKKAAWQDNIEANWQKVKVINMEDDLNGKTVKIRNKMKIKAKISLANIKPEDVYVQLYSGYLDSKNVLSGGNYENMKMISQDADGSYIYEIELETDKVGHCGYTVRVIPQYLGKIEYIPGLIKWF